MKTKQDIHVYLMGFSWNTSCFSLRTAHEFRRGNKIMLLVCGGDMDDVTPPTPSDSLCQALDLSQVQHARFQNGAPFCGTTNSLSTSLAYHDIKDVMVSAWAPAVGHIVDVRWVPRITRKTRRWRCVESVTVSVVSVSAQLVMEDMSVCRACDPLDHLSHHSTVDL